MYVLYVKLPELKQQSRAKIILNFSFFLCLIQAHKKILFVFKTLIKLQYKTTNGQTIFYSLLIGSIWDWEGVILFFVFNWIWICMTVFVVKIIISLSFSCGLVDTYLDNTAILWCMYRLYFFCKSLLFFTFVYLVTFSSDSLFL